MTNKATMIEKLKNGDFIILDDSSDEYPEFKEIHGFGFYGSSFKQHSHKIKDLFLDTDIYERIATGQAKDGTNYIYLYEEYEDTEDEIDEDSNEEYVSMHSKVEKYLREKGHII